MEKGAGGEGVSSHRLLCLSLRGRPTPTSLLQKGEGEREGEAGGKRGLGGGEGWGMPLRPPGPPPLLSSCSIARPARPLEGTSARREARRGEGEEDEGE